MEELPCWVMQKNMWGKKIDLTAKIEVVSECLKTIPIQPL